MNRVSIPVLLISVSISWCQIEYQPIAGELLEYWNTTNSSCFDQISVSDSYPLPDGISQLLMTCIEIEQGLLDIYLLGISPETEIPFLLATGEYMEEYNLERAYMYYHAEEDEFELIFYMPGCSREYMGYYEWDTGDRSLVRLRYYTEDRSLDALERAESLLMEGDIPEAIDELNHVSDDRYYYDRDEMIARLLRVINRAALEEADENNYQGAVDIFTCLSNYSQISSHWYTSFTDSLAFMESNRSNFMGLSEYAMILNNYAFFLEQTDNLFLSQEILENVLDLGPSRIVAHLNLGDVMWKLGALTQAEEHYGIYLEMMTDRDLTDQIPLRVHERIIPPLAAPAHSVTVNLLSEELLPIETVNRQPVRIDSFRHMESGGMSVFASRALYTCGVNYATDSWTIFIGSGGNSVSIEETVPYHRLILTLYGLGEKYENWLIACTAQGDTVWTCALEGTYEFDNSPDVAELQDGGYLISSYSEGYIARISSDGELLWYSFLSTGYMLGIPGFEAENCPRILSVRETSRGDFLMCGSVAKYLTSPDGLFVCLLDGDSGELLWKTVNFAIGEAEVCDAIETSSGMIVAVGTTARSITPEDAPYCTIWGSKFPLIAVLNDSGELQKVLVCDLDLTDNFYSIIETDQQESEFLIFGGDSLCNESVLLRVIIPTDSASWGTGYDYQLNLIDCEGNEYRSDEYGICSRVGVSRSANRGGFNPDFSNNNRGFRIARSLH